MDAACNIFNSIKCSSVGRKPSAWHHTRTCQLLRLTFPLLCLFSFLLYFEVLCSSWMVKLRWEWKVLPTGDRARELGTIWNSGRRDLAKSPFPNCIRVGFQSYRIQPNTSILHGSTAYLSKSLIGIGFVAQYILPDLPRLVVSRAIAQGPRANYRDG